MTFRAVDVVDSRTIAAAVVPQKNLHTIRRSLALFTVTEEIFVRKLKPLKFEMGKIRKNLKVLPTGTYGLPR